MECSLFKVTGEDFDTGFDAVDGVTSARHGSTVCCCSWNWNGHIYRGRSFISCIRPLVSTGATMNVINWNSTAKEATLQLVEGSINDAKKIVWRLLLVQPTQSLPLVSLNEFFAKDPIQNNTDFGFGSASFLDFTDTDPFSEGDL